jgi:hypothetical protein
MRLLTILMMLIGAALVLAGSVMVPAYLSKDRPGTPKPVLGQVVPFNNHGRVTYISRHDALASTMCVVSGAFIGILGGALYRRQASRNRA